MRLLPLSFVSTLIFVSAVASAQVPTSLLDDSNDGVGTGVGELISNPTSNPISANVATDQFSERLFTSTGGDPVFISLFSQAGLAGQHRLGWYAAGDSSNINWILGDVTGNGSQTSFNVADINTPFGLVLDNGIGNLFYSESSLNPTSLLTSANPDANGFDRANMVAGFYNQGTFGGLILSWEDLMGQTDEPGTGLLDYNDYALLMTGAQPVPEPGLMLAIGAGAAAIAARRRKKS